MTDEIFNKQVPENFVIYFINKLNWVLKLSFVVGKVVEIALLFHI